MLKRWPEWHFIRIFEVNDTTMAANSYVAGVEQVCRGVEVPFVPDVNTSCIRNSEMIHMFD